MGAPSDNWMIGCIIISIAMLMIFLSKLNLIPSRSIFNIKIVYYFLWLIKEIFLSSLNITFLGLKKNLKLSSVKKIINTNQSTELGNILLANSITLTPGTVTISKQDKTLTVQAISENLIEDLENGTMKRFVNSVIKEYK